MAKYKDLTMSQKRAICEKHLEACSSCPLSVMPRCFDNDHPDYAETEIEIK